MNSNYKNLTIKLIKKKYVSFFIGLIITSIFIIYPFFKLTTIVIAKTNYFKKEKTLNTGKITEKAAKTHNIQDNSEKYIVKEGDFLWKIATDVYGDGFQWEKIAKANNLTNFDNLTEGTILIIPR